MTTAPDNSADLPAPPASAPAPDSIPTALLRPARRTPPLLPWLIPLAAFAIAAILTTQALAARGPRIVLLFADGHGLKANDPVVFRGVQIGRIREITLDPATTRVRVEADLDRSASALARSGCFWIVHPEVSISRISGIETLLGPRYLAAAIPPEGETSDTARESPPPLSWYTDDPGLTITITAPRAGSVTPGSPVSFRETPVGTVTGVELAPDGRSVLMAATIRPEHAHLVRANSVFWNVSGIGLDVGLVGGLKLKAESLQTIFAGGLAFATPNKPGGRVAPGATFELASFDSDYLKWSPDLTGN